MASAGYGQFCIAVRLMFDLDQFIIGSFGIDGAEPLPAASPRIMQ
jgi:hypothetical protein